jgi:hypothetical protein
MQPHENAERAVHTDFSGSGDFAHLSLTKMCAGKELYIC